MSKHGKKNQSYRCKHVHQDVSVMYLPVLYVGPNPKLMKLLSTCVCLNNI